MWRTKYKDYPKDSSWKKERRETGKGIVGCEMNELYGWGESHHISEEKPSYLKKWLKRMFKKK